MKRCRGNPSNLLTVSHWMLQKFCNFSCTVCRRNSETTSPLDVAEILLPLTHWMLQKFCNHLYTGCCRNSVTTNTLSVAEILQPLIHWVSQRFCDNSYAGCCRNSATTYSLGVAEILQPLIHQVLQKGVAEILQQLIHWVSQKFCNHSDSLLWLKGYFTSKISPLTDFCVHDRTWSLFALVVIYIYIVNWKIKLIW